MKKLLFILIACGYTFALQAQKISLSDKEIETVRQVVKTYCDNIVLYSQKDDIEAHDKLLKLFDNRNNLVYNDLTEKYSEMEVFNYLKQIVSKFDNKLKVNFLENPKRVDIVTVIDLGVEYEAKQNEVKSKSISNNDAVKSRKGSNSEAGQIQTGISEAKLKYLGFVQVELTKEIKTKEGKKQIKIQLLINPKEGKIVNVFSPLDLSIDDALLEPMQLFQKGKLLYQQAKNDTKADTLEIYKNVIKYYLRAAEKGNPTAQYQLGNDYQFGNTNLTTNKSEAFKWYMKAAKQNYAIACNQIGYFYGQGWGATKNEKEMFKWYMKSSETGNDLGMYNLAYLYQFGIGVDKNYEKAMNYYKKAADLGYIDAYNNIGYMHNQGIGCQKDDSISIQYYLIAAEKGNALAQYNVGIRYHYGGVNLKPNFTKAFQYYKMAAEQGIQEAQNNLASLYRDGKGVEKNVKEAMNWYLKAVAQGYVNSMNNIGSLYEGEKNYADAMNWYLKAAEKGHDNAQANIGYLYESGLGVKADTIKAKEWFLKAANQNNTRAISELAWICEDEGNYKEAFKWWSKLAELGDAYAKKILGDKYKIGEGIAKNLDEAEKWYLAAANQNYMPAYNGLGNLYMKEDNFIRKDTIKAFEFYNKAINIEVQDTLQLTIQSEVLVKIGMHYANGYKLAKKDYQKAISYYMKAEKLLPIAKTNIGGLYYEGGYGIVKNIDSTIVWYERAALHAYRIGEKLNICANLSSLNFSHKKDYKEALAWLEFGDRQNEAQCQYILGNLYLYGDELIGINKNIDKCIELYKKAALNGSIEAENFLKKMHLNEEINVDKLGKIYDEALILSFRKEKYEEAIGKLLFLESNTELGSSLSILTTSLIAYDYAKTQQIGKAEEYIAKFFKTNPINPSTAYSFAFYTKALINEYYDKDGKLGTAKAQYEKFLQLVKDNKKDQISSLKKQVTEAHLYLGRYYAGRKDSKLSLQHYEAVLSYDPQNEEALRNTKK